MKRKLYFFVFMLLFISGLRAQLSVGDIAIVGVNSDAVPDELAIVTLAEISSGETIYISDYPWDGSSFVTANGSNGSLTWTTTSNVPAGTVLSITYAAGPTIGGTLSSYGTVSATGWTSAAISSGGDSWLIFQGTNATTPTTFISGFANWSTSAGTIAGQWRTSGTVTTPTSYLPSGLTLGINAIGLTTATLHADNMVYQGVTGTDKATILAAIMNTGNWYGNEIVTEDLSVGGTNFPGSNPVFTIPSGSSPVSASITAQTNVDCNGSPTGSITATAADGGPNYTYAWSNGSTTSNTSSTTNAITNLAAGTYTVTITDNNGSTATASSTVTQPTLLSATTGSVGNISCNGGSDGQITGSATGGTSPYTYAWNTGGTAALETSLSAGTYTVTITDNNGCTSSSSATITEPTALVASASVSASIDCNGDTDGQITGSATGGTSPYTYAWNTGGTAALETSLSAGTYYVTITDDNGCTDSASVTLTEPAAIALNASTTATSIDLAVSGGVSPYDYLWSSGATSEDISGLSSGTYTVTVTDDNGCTASLSATAMAAELVCYNGLPDTLKSAAAPSGGSGNFIYEWQTSADGSTNWSAAPGDNDSVIYIPTTAVADTIYFRRQVTDTSCSTIGYSNVKAIYVLDSIGISGTPTPSTCGASDGALDITVSGGQSPYTFAWSNSASTEDIVSIAAGNYTVTITDNLGCTNSKTFVVTGASSVTASAVVDSNISCNGLSDGGATSSATGGSTPYSYLWSNAATTASITGVAAGTYTVTITDNNGCTATASATVTQPAALVASSVVDSNITCNGNYDGGATASATGGTTPYTYLWNNAATTASITGVAAGTYTVTITDNNGCTSSASATVTQPTVLVAASVVDSNVTCNGNSDGGATAAATGGSGHYTYLWSNSATTASITGVSAGTYTVTVTDYNGCSDTSSVTITEPATLVASSVVDSNVSCSGNADGGATASATGGTMPYSYIWSNTATTSSIVGVSAGTYTVTITDANGCTQTQNITINEPASLSGGAVN